MFNITKESLPGVRKAAHYALIMALNGAFFQIQREQKAANDQTVDSFNELSNEEHEVPGPVGLDQERSPWQKFARIYYALAAAIAQFDNKYVLAMSPEAMWEYLSTSSEHPRVNEKQIADIADALEFSVEDVRKGMHAAMVAEDNRRIAASDATLDLVTALQDEGSVDELETLTLAERGTMIAKFIEGLSKERDRMFNTGLVFRLKDGTGTVRLMMAEIKDAEKQLKQLAA